MTFSFHCYPHATSVIYIRPIHRFAPLSTLWPCETFSTLWACQTSLLHFSYFQLFLVLHAQNFASETDGGQMRHTYHIACVSSHHCCKYLFDVQVGTGVKNMPAVYTTELKLITELCTSRRRRQSGKLQSTEIITQDSKGMKTYNNNFAVKGLSILAFFEHVHIVK